MPVVWHVASVAQTRWLFSSRIAPYRGQRTIRKRLSKDLEIEFKSEMRIYSPQGEAVVATIGVYADCGLFTLGQAR